MGQKEEQQRKTIKLAKRNTIMFRNMANNCVIIARLKDIPRKNMKQFDLDKDVSIIISKFSQKIL